MPFNTLMLTCLSQKTSFRESGATVSVAKQSGETILLFVLDPQSNHESTVVLDLPLDGPICDLAFYYATSSVKRVCLVELKGADINHALDQLINTKEKIEQALDNARRGKGWRRHAAAIEWLGYVRAHGSSPTRKPKNIEARLRRCFGKGNFKLSSRSDIGRFLRRQE